jgi:ABC-type transport system involved in Fe-S cluster assembly fused permease/ATPase subunit
VSIAGIVVTALIGAFLPVPMAFDVVIAYIAMSSGVPLPYVVVILCTLGIYSVYSLAVVGKTISWRVASAAYAAVAFLGVVAGIATRLFI